MNPDADFVLSDLHANVTALDAVLEAAQGRWNSPCAGDVVGYGPDPNEVTARLRKLGTQTIRVITTKQLAGVMPRTTSIRSRKRLWTGRALNLHRALVLACGASAWSPRPPTASYSVHGAFQDEDDTSSRPRRR